MTPLTELQALGQAFDGGWRDIASAPKDGRVIELMHVDAGVFRMAWNPAGTNHLFAPGEVGIWEAPDRSMTWREGEEGPSHWRDLTCRNCSAILHACTCPDLVAAGLAPVGGA